MTAAAVPMHLFNNFNLHFFHDDVKKPPFWESCGLVGWEKKDYHPMCNAYVRVCKALSIFWGKVTHVRKLAVDRSKHGGGMKEDIGQMMGHSHESLEVSHMPQLPPDIMHVAAGFSLHHGKSAHMAPHANVTFEGLLPGVPCPTDDDLALMLWPLP